jgi:rRNA processing protein Krr1/Pno1
MEIIIIVKTHTREVLGTYKNGKKGKHGINDLISATRPWCEGNNLHRTRHQTMTETGDTIFLKCMDDCVGCSHREKTDNNASNHRPGSIIRTYTSAVFKTLMSQSRKQKKKKGKKAGKPWETRDRGTNLLA